MSSGKTRFLTALVVTILLFASTAISIPIENTVVGEPEIECGPTSIGITSNTRNSFEGHVYVKGLYDRAECRSDEGGRPVASIELSIDSCNVARSRSLNPRGIFVSTTIVITFHPLFITKVDRAYRVQCFYMEADKTVSTQIEVSEITTAFATQLIPMPTCRYEILDGGPAGQPVQYATIGQQVYHKWTCDSETVDTFCALVHSCTVDDGKGDTIEILNENGCALDKFLLNNLEYPSDLMAGQEAHVYKYADRSQLYYQCQITITIKEPNIACAQPKCAEPQGFGARKISSRARASAAVLRTNLTGANVLEFSELEESNGTTSRFLKKRSVAEDRNTIDVRTDISAIDIIDDQDAVLSSEQRYRANQYRYYHHNNLVLTGGICVSHTTLTFFLPLIGFFIATSACLIRASTYHRQNKTFW